MHISDAGDGTRKDWPTGRGDLNLQHIYMQGLTMAAGRVERGTLLLGTTVRNRLIVPSVSSAHIFTLYISYTNSINLGAIVSLSW